MGKAMAEHPPQSLLSEPTAFERSGDVQPGGAVSTGLDPMTSLILDRCRIGIGFGVLILGGAVALGGWVGGAEVLTNLVPGLNSMKFNAAVCIAALGTGLALADATPNLRRVGKAGAALALALALLTLSEYAFHWNLGIDQLFIADVKTPVEQHPGRPALVTALMVALLAVALLCAHMPRLSALKTFSAVAASLISWAALNEYVFGVDALRAVPLFSSIPLHAAVGTLLLGLGALSAPPVSWPIPTVLAKSTGAVICRWLLPPAIIAPPLIGWALSRAPAVGAEQSMLHWALYSAISSLGSVWLILLLAQRITLVDVQRAAATQLSRSDALTGLANRRMFDAFLLEGFRLARRHNRPLSLMMLDIDRFKSYNDQYGHPAGDRLLAALGDQLSSLARQTDLVARVGGEEFAIVLPETDLAGARVIAERARAEVEQSSHRYERPVTVSIGIAEMRAEVADCSMLVQEADTGLYRAKRAGRNRVMQARDEPAGAQAQFQM
jgi:diguanylate cyclase (GGDEF)-like protein